MKRREFINNTIATAGAIAANLEFIKAKASADVSLQNNTTAQPFKANLFPVEDVRITGGPFLTALNADRNYLLLLNPDSLLAFMREQAGLKPKAPHYGGWESGGSGMIGHYLSACSYLAAATGDSSLLKRVHYVVSEMHAIQMAQGNGALYAGVWDKAQFDNYAQGKVEPVITTAWYVQHKNLAGLRDAWLLCKDELACTTFLALADWCIADTKSLTADQWQLMLTGEYGGMNEVLADAYAISGKEKYLALAKKFTDPLMQNMASNNSSYLYGLHANTQIPKVVGYARVNQLTGDPNYGEAASHFWKIVTETLSWVNGGDSQWEHFFDPAKFPEMVKEQCGPESCNSYNMLKLTRKLFEQDPQCSYIDYYERTLFNHLLPAIDPVRGGFVYYSSMRPGQYRVFSDRFNAFWCCVGTGMENPGRYGEMIYGCKQDSLFINLFIPSTLNWHDKGVTIEQTTNFPDSDTVRFKFTMSHPANLNVFLRCPSWISAPMQVLVNGRKYPGHSHPGSYLQISRLWKTGDTISITLPMHLHTESLPNSSEYVAFLKGPIVLAGKLGNYETMPDDFIGDGWNGAHDALALVPLPESETPVLDSYPTSLESHLTPVAGKPLEYTIADITQPDPVTLAPLYSFHREREIIYWPVLRGQQLEEWKREHLLAQKIQKATVDHVNLRQKGSEKSHALKSAASRSGDGPDPYTTWRDATGFFSYRLGVSPTKTNSLCCVYWGSDSNRTFSITVDGVRIADVELAGTDPGNYIHSFYPIPASLTRGKQAVRVAFVAEQGNIAGGLFDLRSLEKWS